MILFTTWFGTFLYEDEAIVKSKTFPNDAKEIAMRLSATANGEVLEEEKLLSQGLETFLVLDERLVALGGELIEEGAPYINPEEHGFSKDILHEAMMILAREKAKPKVGADENLAHLVGLQVTQRVASDIGYGDVIVPHRLFDGMEG